MSNLITEYKPGDRVKLQGKEVTLKRFDEGRWVVETANLRRLYDIRPSELTPADPAPDAATLEATRIWEEGHALIAGKAQDASWAAQEAHIATMARYIRANPPLTVERVERAYWNAISEQHLPMFFIRLHAALTEQQP